MSESNVADILSAKLEVKATVITGEFSQDFSVDKAPEGFFQYCHFFLIKDSEQAEKSYADLFTRKLDFCFYWIADEINSFGKEVEFITLPARSLEQAFHTNNNVSVRITSQYDMIGKYTWCEEHLDEYGGGVCPDTCDFMPKLIRGSGVQVYVDYLISLELPERK